MSAILAVLAVVVLLAALAVAAVALRRGGGVPVRRLLAMVAGGAVVVAATSAVARATLATPLGSQLAALADAEVGAASAVGVAFAVLAAGCLVLGMRGDALASPSAGVGYGLAFALGGFLGSSLVELARGRAGVREVIVGAALGATFAAVLGAFVGASRLQAVLPVKLGLVAGGVVAGAAAALGALAAYLGPLDSSVANACASMIAVSVGMIAVTVTVSWLVERRIVRDELGEEVELGVLGAELPPAVASFQCFGGADWWPRRDERWAIVDLLTQLAYRKHQLRQLDGERASIYSLEVGRLRERARRILAASAGDGEGRGDLA